MFLLHLGYTILYCFSGIVVYLYIFFFFFSSRRRHTRYIGDWSSDVCSSDLALLSASIFFFGIFALAGAGLCVATGLWATGFFAAVFAFVFVAILEIHSWLKPFEPSPLLALHLVYGRRRGSHAPLLRPRQGCLPNLEHRDRKSTRLNSS